MSPLGNRIAFVVARVIPLVVALIALLLHTHVHVSAFAPVPSSATTYRDVSCNVFNNKNKNTAPGSKKPVIGGLNSAFKTSKPKTTAKKSVQAAKKNNAPAKKTQPTGSVFNVKMSEETPWSSILVSFLIPWRNPNSIFLYLLIIVSVLGKMNEH